MNEWNNLSLVYSAGALVLVGSALVSYRLPLGKTLKLALVWLLIFGAAFLAVALAQNIISSSSDDGKTPREETNNKTDGPWV